MTNQNDDYIAEIFKPDDRDAHMEQIGLCYDTKLPKSKHLHKTIRKYMTVYYPYTKRLNVKHSYAASFPFYRDYYR